MSPESSLAEEGDIFNGFKGKREEAVEILVEVWE